MTASEVQSPAAVPEWIARTESTMALAADPADDAPRALIIAAPRLCTVEINSCFSQASSPITSGAGRPPIRAFQASGYWVLEWLPQIARLLMSATGTPAFF